MNQALEHLSKSAIVAAIEQNVMAFSARLSSLPQAEVHEDAQVLRVVTGLPSSMFNLILWTQFDPDEVDSRIEQELAYFRRHRLPMTWWIGPSTRPTNLGMALKAHGLYHALDSPGMAVDLLAMPAEVLALAEVTITPVNDPEGMWHWVSTFAACNQFSEQAKRRWLDVHSCLGLGQDAPWRHYIAWLGSEPVATSLLFLHAGVAGIYRVATLPARRGQGIGTAMTIAPLREALALGYRTGVLDSTEMAVPLYRSLGFQEYCTFSVYVWSP